MTNPEFVEWLENEMKVRHWRPVNLAQASGLSQATLGNVLSGRRSVGTNVAVAIAKGLGVPADHVFRKAGLLPSITLPPPDRDPTIQEILDITKQLDANDREELLAYAKLRYQRAQSHN